MFMTSLRWEPIRGHQNCPIATIWCTIKCVLTKIVYLNSFSFLNSSELIVNLFQLNLIFCFNHYVLVTPLCPKISFVFNAQIKTTVE